MEITREKMGDPKTFRSRQLHARQMLRGGLEGRELEEFVEQSVLTTTLEKAQNWARANAMWPSTFGLACCAIEMISVVGSPRNDMARFGAEVFRASPRQADMLILSGRVSIKMAPVIRRIYDQMLEPKWVISMGACASSAGMFNNYALVAGADRFLPMDVYVPGCPPRPEALMHGVIKLQERIKGKPDLGWRERYQAEGTEERGFGVQEEPVSAPPAGTGDRRAERRGADLIDATGLELVAQQVRDSVQDVAVVYTRHAHGEAMIEVAPGGHPRRCSSSCAARPRSRSTSSPACTACDYFPEEPRLARALPAALDARAAPAGGEDARRRRGPRAATVTDLFPGANLQEREVFDFFGVRFMGHPDLRRTHMPEDYEGHPQRRDFPIGGEPVLFTFNEK